MEGKTPTRVTVEGALPFILLKDESLIWYQKNCGYMEEKTCRSYVGGSQGASIRIAKGLYYRTSAFRGHPVEETRMAQLDTGTVGITDKHIYFTGNHKSFRIAYPKIVSFVPYSDGFGLFRDAANAKEQVFVTGNGWFCMNLVSNLAKR